MLQVRYSTRFKKDFKSCVKQHKNLQLLHDIIETLSIPEALPQKNRDHMLSGDYSGYRECHIEPDWLLIYQQTDTELKLARTGSHADLFKM